MHDAQSRLVAYLHDGKAPNAPAAPPDAVFLYCNPCLGVPLVAIEYPLFFFGIQIAAGFAALLMLLLMPSGLVDRCPRGLP
jgi:hypothetical protein